MSSPVRTIELNNGVKIPIIGTGAYAHDLSTAKDWLVTALKNGFRHIDTAQGYNTEVATAEAIKESGIPREEIFITTKLPMDHHGRVAESLEESLKNLGTYIDLYLVHWPQNMKFNADGSYERDDSATFLDSWPEMEKTLESGKVRAIGISNFSIMNMEKLFEIAKVIPTVNQVELHPYLAQNELRDYCLKKGIALAAYAPSGYSTVRNDPVIGEVAKKHGCTPNQVTLAWHIARDTIIVPKSTNSDRQKENITLPTLDEDDMQRINGLDRNQRVCNYPKGPNNLIWGWSMEDLGW